MPRFRAFDVAVIGICAALYAAVGYLTAGVTFLGVAFLPAVVIPAVFAVLFGPWVGGFGGAIGIFIRDMLAIGIPALSLSAGVPPNFILFFLIGYLAHRNIELKKTVIVLTAACVALIVPTAIFLPQVESYTGLSSLELALVFSFTIVLSLVAIAVVSVRWKQWRSFAIGSVVAQAAGAGLLSVTVWVVSPLFLSYFGKPFPLTWVLPLFVWTFATEIPFILLVGPPVINVCYRAFPNLSQRQMKSQRKVENFA